MLNSKQRDAKEAATEYFFQPTGSAETMGKTSGLIVSENIVGWGIGIRDSDEDTVRVYVKEFLPYL